MQSPATGPAPAPPSREGARVIAAFAIVYVVWGSTYLAIRFAVTDLPPFLVGGARFLIAGSILLAWARIRGDAAAEAAERRGAAIGGLFLLLGGNGAVMWAEQRVPSGAAALIVATMPIWMVLLEWARPGGMRPRAGVFVGLALGLAGLALLVDPATAWSSGSRGEGGGMAATVPAGRGIPGTGSAGGGAIDLLGAAVLCLGAVSWAAGSIYSRQVRLPRSPLVSNATQMIAGGAGLALLGLLAGEASGLDLGGASTRSLLSVLYLVVFGSLIGFTAYTYILRVSTPARVSTYAYVNPVVAVILGWAFAHEPITARTMAAAAVILASVAILTLSGSVRQRSHVRPPPDADPGPDPGAR